MKTMLFVLFCLSFTGQAADRIPVQLNGGLTTSVHNTTYQGKAIPACYFVYLVKANGNAVGVSEAYSFLAGQVLYLPVASLEKPCDREKVAEWYSTENNLLENPAGEASYERWTELKKVPDGESIRLVLTQRLGSATEAKYEQLSSRLAGLEMDLARVASQVAALKTSTTQIKQLEQQVKQLEQQLETISLWLRALLVVTCLFVSFFSLYCAVEYIRAHYAEQVQTAYNRLSSYFRREPVAKESERLLGASLATAQEEPRPVTQDVLESQPNAEASGSEPVSNSATVEWYTVEEPTTNGNPHNQDYGLTTDPVEDVATLTVETERHNQISMGAVRAALNPAQSTTLPQIQGLLAFHAVDYVRRCKAIHVYGSVVRIEVPAGIERDKILDAIQDQIVGMGLSIMASRRSEGAILVSTPST